MYLGSINFIRIDSRGTAYRRRSNYCVLYNRYSDGFSSEFNWVTVDLHKLTVF